MPTKFIFLDIDGVMKPGRSYFCDERAKDGDGGFDPLAVAAINRICKHTGAHVVFNTMWNTIDIEAIGKVQGLTATIAGKTKYPNSKDRLHAILMWLEANGCQDAEWIAIDDCYIKHERAILVHPDDGITVFIYRLACEKLGNPDPFMLLL